MLSSQPIWLDGFVGVGYSFRYVYPCILLLFDNKKRLKEAWDKAIKWWPDDEIKIRYVEVGGRDYSLDVMDGKERYKGGDGKYAFIMYCRSRILHNTWVAKEYTIIA